MTKANALLLSLLLGFTATASTQENEMSKWGEQAAARCSAGSEELIYTNDVGWGLSFADAESLFKNLYTSKKRLDRHFYFSKESGGFVAQSPVVNRDLNIPIHFVYSIKKHIEESLKREYAQWVFFPDMGHNHFFIPVETYEKISTLPRDKMMEAMISAPDLKMLYHVLEQIEVMNMETKELHTDIWSQWRYYTRNIVGDNQGKGHIEIHKNLTESYNTVRDAEGYRYWGAGVNVSANENGCFSYQHKGQTFYFDVSFFDLPYDPSAGGFSQGDY